MKTCTNCGAVIDDNALFCTVCGKPADTPVSGDAPATDAGVGKVTEAAVTAETETETKAPEQNSPVEQSAEVAAAGQAAASEQAAAGAAAVGAAAVGAAVFSGETGSQGQADPGMQGGPQPQPQFGSQPQYGSQPQFGSQQQYGSQPQYGYQQQNQQYYQQPPQYYQQPVKTHPVYKPENPMDKFLSLLCYTGLIGVLFAYFGGDVDGKRSDYLKFHANQGLIMNLFALLCVVPFVGWIWATFVVVCEIVAFVNACQGKTDPILFFGSIRIIK